MMLTPNPATPSSRVRPLFRSGGCRVAHSITSRAPTAGAASISPNPRGPTPRMSEAKTGSSATTPPNSTANRSSAIDPRITGSRRTNLRPPRMLWAMLSRSGGAGCGFGLMRHSAAHAVRVSPAIRA